MAISVIIITKNAGATIRRCLESVAWADEVVVIDSGSSDDTLDICRELGARVSVTDDWPGFGPQKNRALDAASGDWLFNIDADEWVTPELGEEIRSAVAAANPPAAYALPRRSSFCGRYMKHSGWWPDYVVRLFRREAARFSDDQAHERLIVNGKTLKLKQPLMHEAISDLDQMIGKMNLYSTASARGLHARGRRASLGKALLHGGWAFFRTYVLRAGFLDGREGLMLAIANAEGSYYRYVKLMLLEKKVNGKQ
ncbi:MAG: glycosyltransferase family 2 protein [Burkholderiales bacterium]|nr:glycosyltransferase family 2 protein [Burkholderiales bacterium]